MSLQATTSQTVGPYLHIGLTWLITEDLAPSGVAGERISIDGRVIDGDGKPVNDALVEIWQADANGKYAHPLDRQAKPQEKGFRGFGRSLKCQNARQGRDFRRFPSVAGRPFDAPMCSAVRPGSCSVAPRTSGAPSTNCPLAGCAGYRPSVANTPSPPPETSRINPSAPPW